MPSKEKPLSNTWVGSAAVASTLVTGLVAFSLAESNSSAKGSLTGMFCAVRV